MFGLSTINLPRRGTVVTTLLLTLAIELVTVLLRFGADLESTRDTASTIGLMTMGFRVHHGYIGVLLVICGLWVLDFHKKWSVSTAVAGSALFLSDMIHHFCILWPITGSPHFDFFYPG